MINYQWAHNESTFICPIHKQQSNVWAPLLDYILNLTNTYIYNNLHVLSHINQETSKNISLKLKLIMFKIESFILMTLVQKSMPQKKKTLCNILILLFYCVT